MKRARTALTPLGVLFLATVVACGGVTKKDVLDTVRVTGGTVEGALNGLRDSFLAWNEGHEAEIVAAATSHADGEARLAAYRKERQKIEKLFAVGYAAVGAVAALAPLVAVDLHPLPELITLLQRAVSAVHDVEAAITALQGAPS